MNHVSLFIDAVFVEERFVGTRALLNPENLRSALLTVADPAAVGITGIDPTSTGDLGPIPS